MVLLPEFTDVLNKIAEQLPEGYLIEINVEKDSGWIRLWDAESDVYLDPEHFTSVDSNIEEQIEDAIRYAKGDIDDGT